jgi:hypothetical protein
MADYEWEVRRVPRAADLNMLERSRLRRSPVGEYAALEFPRESLTWVVRTQALREAEGPTIGLSRGAKPMEPGSVRT